MKRNIYISIIAFIASISAQASSFNLQFERPANYTVVIDGMNYPVYNSRFTIPVIRPGRHHLVIESYAAPVNQRRRPMPIVLYNGPLDIREYSEIFATLDHHGFHIDRVIPQRQSNYNRRHHYHFPYNDNNNRYDQYNDCEEYRDNNDDYYDQGDDRDNDGYGNNNNNRFLNSRDFDALKHSISNAQFESTKRTVAMAGISQNNLSIYQLKEIIQLFSFESTKLEIAKYAYNYSSDKSRFYILSDAFTFDSSKDEIARLSGRR